MIVSRNEPHACLGDPIVAVPSLEVSDLHVSYGDIDVLKGIDLTIGQSEFTALLGPSGCGKSSLLRTIAGFVPSRRGGIRLNGKDVAQLSARDRNLGIVFQSYALFPHMTVLENVLFGLQCRKLSGADALERAQTALAMVSLSGHADKKPGQLSGGQQQRVALARATVIQPDLLLLDEPLGALDKQLRVQMQSELKALQRKLGVAALFVTHDQEEAMSMADRIVVMRDGRIEQIGTAEELFQRPNSSWMCTFFGGGNLVTGDVIHGENGRMLLSAPPGVDIEVDPSCFASGSSVAVQIPFDRIRLERSREGLGLAIKGRRFLGLTVELQLEINGGKFNAHMPVEAAAPFGVDDWVIVSVTAANTRLVHDR